MNINKYYIFAIIMWLLTYMLVPLLRNSIERVYKNQIDSLLKHSLHWIIIVFLKFTQLILILLFCPTLLSKIPNFMREKAQEEYEPIAEAILDKNFPYKIKASWNKVRGTIFGIGFGYFLMILMMIFGSISKSR